MAASDNANDINVLVLDEQTFEVLFNQYWNSVYAVCLKFTGSEEDSRELTQDIFFSLWQRRDVLEIKTTISAYLYGAAKLKSFDFMRTQARQKEKTKEIFLRAAEDHFSSDSLEYKELHASFLKFMSHLPEPGKKVFRLSREDGLSHKAIAAITGMSVGMVEYYIGSTLRILRSKLKSLQ